MCKSAENQNKAIDNLYAKLRDEVYSRPHAIYEHTDYGDDLVGFAAFVEGTLNFFRVMPDNSVRCDGLVSYPAMGARGIAHQFGGDYAVAM